MKIVGLEVENIKKIRAVKIAPDGAVVRIEGKCEQGKTSLLDSIAFAMGGEKLCPTEPIRRGEKSARVQVELDEDLVIERRWTESGSRLEVRNRAGMVYKSPQKMLDALIGRLSFDPLAFKDMLPKAQSETLRELVGIDFKPLEAKRAEAYQRRTSVNRELGQLRARVAAIPEDPGAPDDIVGVGTLLAEQAKRQDQSFRNHQRRSGFEEFKGDWRRFGLEVQEAVNNVTALKDQLARAERTLQLMQADQEKMRLKGAEFKQEVDALVDPDLLELPAKIETLEKDNERARMKLRRDELQDEVGAMELEAKGCDDAIAAIDLEKAALLAQAKFPVEGLGFTDDGVTLDGLPLDQAAESAKLRVSLAMGIKLNPKLRVILIRNGSLLDKRAMQLVQEMAEANDHQVWIEIVTEGDGVGITIEDGMVVGAEAAPTPKKKG